VIYGKKEDQRMNAGFDDWHLELPIIDLSL
jgi:hypothetical protein